MTDADKIMYPQHFWIDPTDIRILINPDLNPVCHSVNRITDERVNVGRQNMAVMDKGWPYRNDHILVVIRIRVLVPDHFFMFSPLRNKGFMDIC